MEQKRRVVITGIGVVAPNGIGIEKFWDSLVHGRSAVRRITHFDASSYPSQVAAEITDFDPTDYMDPKTAKRLDRFAQFALAAADMAVMDSNINFMDNNAYRTGIIIGTGIGGGVFKENQHIVFLEKGIKRLNPFAAIAICPHSAVGAIAYKYGIKGFNTTVASGCNSGVDAVILGYQSIFSGDADVLLIGAAEAPITPYIVALFIAGGFVSKEKDEPHKAVKPYDIHGDGIAIGEGGGVVILEELGNALRRGAKIYGEIIGYASGNEAYSMFEPDPSGDAGEKVIQRALEKSGCSPQDIDYINAHGNGIPAYDLNETIAFKKVFGEAAYRIPISSIKPITGQSFAATGMLQVITCLLSINTNIIPPTINHRTPHPDCDLDYVPGHFRHYPVETALLNAHGFGGSHSVLILKKFK